ncbi:ADP-ribosylation factor GTPase-activating protein AGD3 isoform X2 [Cryptomeria japonica]|nr:ADP-ribosylation factor GTPase-activating protein AGD3 isoform X2 [Cryptomeria japonica]
MFGGGHNDPIGIAFGGPVMTKYTIALREIGTYKEQLRSQVEQILNERLIHFVNIDLHDVKEIRKRFDKASLHYDQAREKYLSLSKSTKMDIVAESEEELRHARSAFEQARFNLVSTLSNIEAKKKFEFLEAVSGTMDAHLRYFKQGYELLHQMEPYIHQVLAYAQQSRDRTNYEQAALAERMQEFKRQIDRESRCSFSDTDNSPTGDGIQAVGRSSHKMIEAAMQSTAKGKVQTIRQGYLSKRSSNLRGDWKRRFFVLDSRGMLYYYRKQHWSKQTGNACQHSLKKGHHATDHVSGLFGRLLYSHHHGPSQDERSVAHHTVNLLTSTIKVDAEQTDLRFCFTIVSPRKKYTLQAENTMDRMDWIEKITGVIASLLSSQLPDQRLHFSPMSSGHHRTASESSSLCSSSDFDHTIPDENGLQRCSAAGFCDHSGRGLHGCRTHGKQESPLELLRKVPGNDVCADCGSSEPDWASLNLGILLCIECSGVHRNLGVHISKVRSLTLDVKVWEPSVLNLFQSLGNTYANSLWEELLESGKHARGDGICGRQGDFEEETHCMPFRKPNYRDTLPTKEKFIQAKYSAKRFIFKPKQDCQAPSVASQIWDAVRANDKKMAYRLILNSNADVNTTYEQARANDPSSMSKATIMRREFTTPQNNSAAGSGHIQLLDSPTTSTSSITDSDDLSEADEGLQQCSLLHLACYFGDLGMLELLLQYGANANVPDHCGRTPLHLCISGRKHLFSKLLITRGANTRALDGDGKTPLQRAMEMGMSMDDELIAFLSENNRQSL